MCNLFVNNESIDKKTYGVFIIYSLASWFEFASVLTRFVV